MIPITFLEKEAVAAATSGNWQKAIKINQKIIKFEPKKISALNRLAQAFFKTGNLTQAKKTYQKVLKIDQYNPIAFKNINRLVDKGKRGAKTNHVNQISGAAFLEEPRKTKISRVLRLTSAQRLAEVHSGDEVKLTPKKRFVCVISQNGIHLGCLPEDLSQRLTTFINGGNRYQAFVKTISRNQLEIIIKETHRSKRFQNQPSF